MSDRVFAAIDLGASGGRVMAGIVSDASSLTLVPIHRFANSVVERDGHLRWDIRRLFDEVLIGLERLCASFPQVEAIGVDSWGVDFGVLRADGSLVADPVSYRDPRTADVIDEVHRTIDPAALFAINGLQFLPFTTLYQLAAARQEADWADASSIALIPDLIAYWLTGVLQTEYTNASTTGLLDIRSGGWSSEILDAIGVPATMLPALAKPGSARGVLLPDVARRIGAPTGLQVVNVASHDTASAVAGIPATDDPCYVVCGTWSLVGLELESPVLTSDASSARFTNEAGIDGTTRFLRNVGGLWLLQECVRTWTANGATVELDELLGQARLVEHGPIFDVTDENFVAPGDMPERIRTAVAGVGDQPPFTTAEVTRCILDSLASAYAAVIDDAGRITGRRPRTVHMVGGGSQNELLCQLTADATGLPVVAGPIETTALGNVAVQARASGALPESRHDVRSSIARSSELRTYRPLAVNGRHR